MYSATKGLMEGTVHEYRCDGCGRKLPKGDLRYTVTIDVKAAYDEIEVRLHDLVWDHRSELENLIRGLNEKAAAELEASVYKKLVLDLCPGCQQAYIRDPLRFHPEQGDAGPGSVDVDGFLRSLGYGSKQVSEDEE